MNYERGLFGGMPTEPRKERSTNRDVVRSINGVMNMMIDTFFATDPDAEDKEKMERLLIRGLISFLNDELADTTKRCNEDRVVINRIFFEELEAAGIKRL